MYRRCVVGIILSMAVMSMGGVGWSCKNSETIVSVEADQPIENESDGKAKSQDILKWSNIPITSKGDGTGGEGGQWPHAIETGKTTIFYGTNTGGIYRSIDGGISWKQTNNGFKATGANAFAIHPTDNNRVLAAGIGTAVNEGNGLYLSEDGGESWELVCKLKICGNKYTKDGLEFDATTTYAYYSSPYIEDNATKLSENEAGLYRSKDAGKTWTLIKQGMSDCWIKVDQSSGALYLANSKSIQVSYDYGETFQILYNAQITGFDLINVQDEGVSLYLSTLDGVLASYDGGNSFQMISDGTYPDAAQKPKSLSVSPVNSQRMTITARNKPDSKYDLRIWYSENGGVTWEKYNYDKSGEFLPSNSRDKIIAWSKTDEYQAYSFGGDGVISTRDGGVNWEWSSDGISGILCGGKFHFNVYDPQIMYFTSQDYNGAITTDGGNTWKYINLAQHSWGGFAYGGYAASEQVMWGGVSESWNGKKQLCITYDGGKTVVKTDYYYPEKITNQYYSSYQSPTDPNVYFAPGLRSSDGGKSWEEMEDCLQVYTHNPYGKKELYGCSRQGGYVMVSYDSGESWEVVNKNFELKVDDKINYITDIAVDTERQKLYVTAGVTKLYCINLNDGEVTDLSDNVLKNERGKKYSYSVAVNSKDNLIYLAVSDYGYNSDNSLLCSNDGGTTWEVLNPNAVSSSLKQGYAGYSVRDVNVHPDTGECWCSCGCYGFAKVVN